MIHSLSGGVISKNEISPFAKVEVEGTPRWYLSPTFQIKEGDLVRVPFEGETRTGVVVRVEKCTPQTAPYPLSRISLIEEIL